MQREQLTALLAAKLNSAQIRDYCPNGLQVEGKTEIGKIITGVTASQALLDEAVRRDADAIIVHHGYFWKNETMVISGMKKRRLQTLLRHDMNLLAYHLPLDIHPELGNNAQLAELLGITQLQPVALCEPLGVLQCGRLEKPLPLAIFAEQVATTLGRQVLAHAAGTRSVEKVALCTGGGQGYIEQAAAAGADLFISGEVSEQTIHIANEMCIHFMAAGHHATERYGIRALSQWLAAQTGLVVEFVDIDNPA